MQSQNSDPADQAGPYDRPGAQQPAEPGVPDNENAAPDQNAAAGAEDASDAGEPADASAQLALQLAERTADLQRLQAEYVNYKKRVDRDRDLSRRAGAERILADLMGVLDNIRSAREHEQMTDGFKLVAGEIEKVASRHGLEAFGEKGDPFDPRIHEALMQTQASGITEPTAAEVLQVGYKVGDRVLRPARVAVAQPAEDAPDQEA
ncbi:molecular chaperone GrpE [Naumannella cuiyingiana]|uniref:Protein GrpE n=1 Tax=Naumannella cuiyingiana TaxID=1347891 RepID=A0A7Z0D8B9_9ACTN|nr:molecular chaperone GrpE [Naumannella cuiyingiana]